MVGKQQAPVVPPRCSVERRSAAGRGPKAPCARPGSLALLCTLRWRGKQKSARLCFLTKMEKSVNNVTCALHVKRERTRTARSDENGKSGEQCQTERGTLSWPLGAPLPTPPVLRPKRPDRTPSRHWWRSCTTWCASPAMPGVRSWKTPRRSSSACCKQRRWRLLL